ncbi:MAG: hypothetical protein QOK15_3761 [Nocardioidaceae bacterium]|nr:hypothetical protein [Nocardioidaceae bacterium]
MTRTARRRDEAGIVTILVALCMVVMLVVVGMVLDFGIARLDRQQNKSVADAAVAAGMRALDGGDGEIYGFKGACQALSFIKANKPELSSLSWSACSDPAKLATACTWGVPATYAAFTGTANGITVEISDTYDLTTSGWPEEALPSLSTDQLTPADSCTQLSVVVRQARRPGFGSIATSGDLTTSVRTVGRVVQGFDDDESVALLLLERTGCDALLINGTNSYVRVWANGSSPGVIHSDSTGETCNQKTMTGDHPNGIEAYASPTAPGIVRSRAVGTAWAARVVDSSLNVVAQNSSITRGPLVSRKPVDQRYITGMRAAVADYETQAATNGSGYTVKSCNASASSLAAVTDKLWIECGTNNFNTAGVTLQASTVFFNAKSISAQNLSMPNATRVYVKGDTNTNGTAISVQGSSFKMHQGSNATCPNTTTTPSLTRARLVVGAGSVFTNSTGSMQLCSTTVVLRGGVQGGCVPATNGTAPSDTATCNGRLSMAGSTDWTAPNKTSSRATWADWSDFEDLALWGEATGSHDIGGGGVMHLSGVFFLPNGAFKVHGGSTQEVRNSQYIARTFRADGGSQLDMQPNPYDVVGIPILTGFSLVR